MKKTVLITLSIFALYSCKKKDTTPTPTNTTPTSTKHCTAKINGGAFAADSYSSFSFGNILTQYNISAFTAQGAGSPTIQLSGNIQTGVHPVGSYPDYYSGSYTINNVTYTAKTGSFNITTLDTLNGSVKHFTATFNFNTDTISGVSYQITEGDINYSN